MMHTCTGECMIFIDTSAFYAMEVQTDVNHNTASLVKADIAKNKYGLLYTTNNIINEALTLFLFKVGHKEAVGFGDKVRKSKSLKIIRIDEAIEDSAWNIFKKHEDKELSFTDCTSFVVMKELDMERAFAFDLHFSQMGFETLPSE